MARPVRIGNRNVDVRFVERQIIVAPVPQYTIGLLLGGVQYLLIIHPREDNRAIFDMGFVLFSLLDGAFLFVHVLDGTEPLHCLPSQVPVWHRMPDNYDAFPHLPQDIRDPPGCLTLAAPGPHRTDAHDRL